MEDDFLDPMVEYETPELYPEDDENDVPEMVGAYNPDDGLDGTYEEEDDGLVPAAPVNTDYDSPLAQTADTKRVEMERLSDEKRARLAQKFEQPVDSTNMVSQEEQDQNDFMATEYGSALRNDIEAQDIVDEQNTEKVLDQQHYDEDIIGWGANKAVTGLGDGLSAVVGDTVTEGLRGTVDMTTDLANWVMSIPKNTTDFIVGKDAKHDGDFIYSMWDYLDKAGNSIAKIDAGADHAAEQANMEAMESNFKKALREDKGITSGVWAALTTMDAEDVYNGVMKAIPYGMALGAKGAISAPVFMGGVMDQTMQDIAGRMENKGGKKLSRLEEAGILAANTALMALEKMAFGTIMGKSSKNKLIEAMRTRLTPEGRAHFDTRLAEAVDLDSALINPGNMSKLANTGKAVGAGTGRVALGIGEETFQEGMQALGSEINTKYGTDKMDGLSFSDDQIAKIGTQAVFGGATGAGMSATIGEYHGQRKDAYERNAEHSFKNQVYSTRAMKDRIEAHAPDIESNFGDKEAQYEVADDLLANGDVQELGDGQLVISTDIEGTGQNIVYPVTKIGDAYYMNSHDMQMFFEGESKKDISERMATLVDNTEKFQDTESVVVDGQKWKKNPNYDADLGIGSLDENGEFVENEQWIQASGKKTRNENELDFTGKRTVDNEVAKINQEADAQIEQETKADVKKEKKLTREKGRLETAYDKIIDAFDTKKTEAETSTTNYQKKIDAQIAKRESKETYITKLEAQSKSKRNDRIIEATRQDIESIGIKIDKLQSKQEANDKNIANKVEVLETTRDEKLEVLQTKIDERDVGIKEAQAAIKETTDLIDGDAQTLIDEVDYKGGTGKTKTKKKTKFRDGLQDIFVQALETKRGVKLTPKQVAAAKGAATRVLNSKNDAEVKAEYIKAFKAVHGEANAKKHQQKNQQKKKTEDATESTSKNTSKPEPADMQERIDNLPKYDEKKLESIIDDLIEEVDEIMEKC